MYVHVKCRNEVKKKIYDDDDVRVCVCGWSWYMVNGDLVHTILYVEHYITYKCKTFLFSCFPIIVYSSFVFRLNDSVHTYTSPTVLT